MKKLLASFNAIAFFAFGALSQSVSLDGDWQLSFWQQPRPKIDCPSKAKPEKTISAKVPGNVEIDMLAAGLIDDPLIGDNVYKLRKYEGYQWLYSRTFLAPKLEDEARAILNLKGVDTLAHIFINGKKVASTANMLIAHKIDITDFLKDGENKIEILLDSVVIEAYNHTYAMACTRVRHCEGLEIRKAPHMFGWDILPRLVSAGIWKSLSVDVQKPERIEDVFWLTTKVDLNKKTAKQTVQFRVPARFEKFDDLRYNVVLKRNGKVAFSSKNNRMQTNNVRFQFNMGNVDFWWPRTMGEPALYEAELYITDSKGHILDKDVKKIGIRTIKLDYADIYPDKDGKFQFIVNGEPIFVFGTNWVPVDALHSRDEVLVDEVLENMKELNCNMVRCWGGNAYENDKFYDFCDENGILIWQDFSMGCSLSSQSDEFKKAIAHEVSEVVKRLRSRPSIALWAGNNENDIAINWGFRDLAPDPSRDEISRKVLPRVLFSEDISRPYLPSSPFVSDDVYKKIAQPSENHLWGPRGYYKADFYTKSPAKFVSEIGYHGCPNKVSLEKMFTKEFVHPWGNGKVGIDFNKQWQCKAVTSFEWQTVGYEADRNRLMARQTKILFGEVPADFDDFIVASQIVQAEAKKYFVEMMRTKKGERSGILWWNLRDGWPVISDSVTDYYNSKKLAYYFLKRVQENVCVMMNDSFELICANETLKPCKVSAKVKDVVSGKVLVEISDVEIASNSLKKLVAIEQQQGQGMLLIEYNVDGKKLENHYMYGLPPFKLADVKKWISSLSIKRN